jgi:hypothetical protein
MVRLIVKRAHPAKRGLYAMLRKISEPKRSRYSQDAEKGGEIKKFVLESYCVG